MCPDTKYFTGGGQGAPDGNDELVLPAGCKEVQDAFTDFWVDFLWDPAAIGLAEEKSLNCGGASFKFAIADFADDDMTFRCYEAGDGLPGPDGEYLPGPDNVWTTYWKKYTGPAPEGLDVDKWQKALEYVGGDYPSNWRIYPKIGNTREVYQFNPEGRVYSDNAEFGNGSPNSWSAVIPPEWFLQKNDDVHNAVMEQGANFHITASRGPSATSECGQVKPVAGPTRRAYGNPHFGAASVPASLSKLLANLLLVAPAAQTRRGEVHLK